MSATMDIVVSAQDQASDVIEGIGETAEETGSIVERNWGTITAVTATAGAASEGFARSQQDTNATVGRMAARTGESEDSLRDMIGGMSDATFSAHDAAAGMEALAQRGIDTREDFEDLLPTFDNFADATGKDMTQGIEEVSRVLGAFNIPVDEAGEHIDTMTHLSENLDVPLDRLGRQLGNNTEELEEMGVGLDGSAAMLQALRDRGMDGRDAMKLFTDSVRDSDGDMDQLLDTLDLTAEEYADYQEQVGDAAGVTDEFADINNATMTPLQRMQANVENLMARYGGLADAAGMAAPVLIAMGPAMKGLSVATRGLGAAMSFLAANPIVLVIAAVAALAVGLVMLWRRSETFRDIVTGAFEAVAAVGSWLWDNVLSPVWDGIKAGFGFLIDAARTWWEGTQLAFEMVGDVVEWLWESVLQPVWAVIRTGFGLLVDAATFYRDVWLAVFDAVGAAVTWVWENVLQPVWDGIKAGFGFLQDAAEFYLGVWQRVFDAVGSAVEWVWNNVLSPTWDTIKAGIDLLGEVIETLGDTWANVWDAMKDAVRAVVNPIIGFINRVIAGVEGLVNAIANGINSIPSFTVPSIVPGIGGTEVGLPTIPTISLPRIPRLHDGGTFRAPTAGGEGLAMLADRETVTPAGGLDLLDRRLAAIERLLSERQVLVVDGDVLARVNQRAGARRQARNLEVRLA